MARLPRNNWSNSGRDRKSFAPLPDPPNLLMCTLDSFIREKLELYLDFPITTLHLDISTQEGHHKTLIHALLLTNYQLQWNIDIISLTCVCQYNNYNIYNAAPIISVNVHSVTANILLHYISMSIQKNFALWFNKK
jgi:hypothetical protein